MEKGTIVKYDGGFYRITRETKNTVNLGAVFGNHIYWKGIPKSEEWKKKVSVPNKKKGRPGRLPWNAKKVLCEGIVFPSEKHAFTHYNISRKELRIKLNDPNNSDFTFV